MALVPNKPAKSCFKKRDKQLKQNDEENEKNVSLKVNHTSSNCFLSKEENRSINSDEKSPDKNVPIEANSESPTLAAMARSLNQLKNIPATLESDSPSKSSQKTRVCNIHCSLPQSFSEGKTESSPAALNYQEDDELPSSPPKLGGKIPSFLGGASCGSGIFSQSFLNAIEDLESVDGTSKLKGKKTQDCLNSASKNPDDLNHLIEDFTPPPPDNPKLGGLLSFLGAHESSGGSALFTASFQSEFKKICGNENAKRASKDLGQEELSLSESQQIEYLLSLNRNLFTESFDQKMEKGKGSSFDEKVHELCKYHGIRLPNETNLAENKPNKKDNKEEKELKNLSDSKEGGNISQKKNKRNEEMKSDDDGLPGPPPNNPKLGEMPSFLAGSFGGSSGDLRFSSIFTESFDKKVREGKSVSFDEKLNKTYDYIDDHPPSSTKSLSPIRQTMKNPVTPMLLNDQHHWNKKTYPPEVRRTSISRQTTTALPHKHQTSPVKSVPTPNQTTISRPAMTSSCLKQAPSALPPKPQRINGHRRPSKFIIPQLSASSLMSICAENATPMPHSQMVSTFEHGQEMTQLSSKTLYRRKKIKIWLEKRKRRQWFKDKPSKYAKFKREEASKRKRDNGRFLKQEDPFVPMTSLTSKGMGSFT